VTGEYEEHVVERWATQCHVEQLDLGSVEPAQCFNEDARATTHGRDEPACVVIDFDVAALGELLENLLGGIEVDGALEDDLDALAADLRFQFVRRALGDGAAVIDDQDVVGEAIGSSSIASSAARSSRLRRARR